MKKTTLFLFVCLMITGALLSSCIKEEALNSEADIEMAILENGSALLQVEPLIGEKTVTFKLRQFSSSYRFAPQFVITDGATIEPASGTELDFFEPQLYTVTSEDGLWKKVYEVSFVVDDGTLFAYSFEHADVVETESPEGIYHKFFDFLPDMQSRREDWDTGNVGYNILAATLLDDDEELTPAFYPPRKPIMDMWAKG